MADSRLNIMAWWVREFIEGRPAEEVPRTSPASAASVPACTTPPPTRRWTAASGPRCRLRPGSPRVMQVMAQINDKILHFFFLAAPDFIMGTRGRLLGAQRPGDRPGQPGVGPPGGADAPGRADDDRKVRRQGHPPGGGGARGLRQVHDRGRAPGTAAPKPGAAGVRPVLHRLRQAEHLL